MSARRRSGQDRPGFLHRSGFETALLAAPVLFLVAVSALPVLYTIAMSVQSVDMFDILSLHRPFVGLRNYIHLFHNPAAGRIALNTLLFTTCSVVAQVTIGFALAVFFQRRFPRRRDDTRRIPGGVDHARAGGRRDLEMDVRGRQRRGERDPLPHPG